MASLNPKNRNKKRIDSAYAEYTSRECDLMELYGDFLITESQYKKEIKKAEDALHKVLEEEGIGK